MGNLDRNAVLKRDMNSNTDKEGKYDSQDSESATATGDSDEDIESMFKNDHETNDKDTTNISKQTSKTKRTTNAF